MRIDARTIVGAMAFAMYFTPASHAQSIAGVVTDSVHRRPLTGALVIATPSSAAQDSVFHSATSDARGRFTIHALRPGRYTITVEHPYTDSTGIGTLPVVAEVSANRETIVAVGIPSAGTLRRALCPIAVRDTTLGVILGTVKRLDRSVAAGATVVFTWSDFDVDRATLSVKPKQISTSVVTDSLGVYRACGLPAARSIFMQAQGRGAEQTGVIEEQIGDAGVLVRDLRLATQIFAASSDSAQLASTPAISAPPAQDTTALGRSVISGRVVSTSASPIASAQVRLFGTSRVAATSADGQFRLNGLPSGTQGLEVLALGYYPRRFRVEVSDDTPPLVIRLERTAVVLDSVRVLAQRVGRPAEAQYREFEERRKQGHGIYFTEVDIERRHPFETADLFKLASGVKVFGMGVDAKIASTRGRATTGNTECPLDLFVDGQRVDQTDLNLVSPSELHGAEIYTTATAPAKYRIGPCGALFLWRK